MSTKVKLKLSPDNYKVKLEERSRGRMKLQIKLSRDEATAFKNFLDNIKPEQLSLDEFCKAIFFTGLDAMSRNLQESTLEYVKEHQEELAASGMDVERFFQDANQVLTNEVSNDNE